MSLTLHLLLQAVFEVKAGKGLVLAEIANGITIDDIRAATGCTFEVKYSLLFYGLAYYIYYT